MPMRSRFFSVLIIYRGPLVEMAFCGIGFSLCDFSPC
jgi:hypothetical protein